MVGRKEEGGIKTMKERYRNLPALLKKTGYFCISKNGKIPLYITKKGEVKFGSSTDPQTWLTFDEACSFLNEERPYLMLVTDGRVIGVDLDVALTPEGKLKPWAEWIINSNTVKDFAYLERSKNSGFHIIFILEDKISNLQNLNWRGKKDEILDKSEGIELFIEKHFVTLTGEAIQDELRLLPIEKFLKFYEELKEFIKEIKIEEELKKIKDNPPSPLYIKELENPWKKLKEEILKKVRFEDIIPPAKDPRNGRYYRAWCPFHEDGKNPDFVVYYKDGWLFDCHDSKVYDIFSYMMKKENKTFKEVYLDLAKRYNIPTPLLEEKRGDFKIYNHYLSHLRNSLKDAELKSLSDSSYLSDSTLENEFERFLFEGFKFPSEILPKNLNESFKNFSEVTGIPFEIIFSCSLPILSSSLGNSVRIKVKEKYSVPIFVWLGLIMKSGEGKTPLISLLTEPLYEEQKELYLESKKEKEEKLLNLSKKEEKEKNFQILIVNEGTLEGLYQVLRQNRRGFLLLNMELGFLLKSLNEYKKKGSDMERLLQLFDAKSLVIVRKEEEIFIPWSGVSILGGIQPEVFPEIFKKEFFLNGLIPRFLWIFGKKKELQIKEINKEKYDFYKKLIQTFLFVPLREEKERLNPFIIHFNDEVKNLFIKAGNFLEKEIFKRTSEELRLFFFKAYYYYLPKFAGILKCLSLFEEDGSLKSLKRKQ